MIWATGTEPDDRTNYMKRYISIPTALVFAFTLAACGGGDSGGDAAATTNEPAGGAPPAAADSGELTTPSWYTYDAAANSVTMTITAGSPEAANGWNFNGGINGDIDVVVPVGASVEITFVNDDMLMAHSLGISTTPGAQLPAIFTDPAPAFEGAMTAGAADQLASTLSGESETITFTADAAGDYTMVCYVPGHALVGMWIKFTVSASGDAGVRGAM